MTLAPLALLGLALCAAPPAEAGAWRFVLPSPATRSSTRRSGPWCSAARSPRTWSRRSPIAATPPAALCPDPLRQPGLDPGHRRARRGRAGRGRPLRRRRPQPPDRRPRPRRRPPRPAPPASPRAALAVAAGRGDGREARTTKVPRAVVFRLGATRPDARLRRGRLPRRDRRDRRPGRRQPRGRASGRRRRQRPGLTDPQDRLWIDLRRRRPLRPGRRAVPVRHGAQPRRGAVRRPLRRAGQPAGPRAAGRRRARSGWRGRKGRGGASSVELHATARPRRLGLRPLRQRAGHRCRSASTGWGR